MLAEREEQEDPSSKPGPHNISSGLLTRKYKYSMLQFVKYLYQNDIYYLFIFRFYLGYM